MKELCELFDKLKLDTEQTKELDLGAADSVISALQSKEGEAISCSYKFSSFVEHFKQ